MENSDAFVKCMFDLMKPYPKCSKLERMLLTYGAIWINIVVERVHRESSPPATWPEYISDKIPTRKLRGELWFQNREEKMIYEAEINKKLRNLKISKLLWWR